MREYDAQLYLATTGHYVTTQLHTYYITTTGIYAGLGSAACGSMPGAALFFCTYEMAKSNLIKGKLNLIKGVYYHVSVCE